MDSDLRTALVAQMNLQAAKIQKENKLSELRFPSRHSPSIGQLNSRKRFSTQSSGRSHSDESSVSDNLWCDASEEVLELIDVST